MTTTTISPRSFIGMTQSARKRRARAVAYIVLDESTSIEAAEKWARPVHAKRFKQRGFPRHAWDMQWYEYVRELYGCAVSSPGRWRDGEATP